MSNHQISSKEYRIKAYSCKFCEFVQSVIELNQLNDYDEQLYLSHLSAIHGATK